MLLKALIATLVVSSSALALTATANAAPAVHIAAARVAPVHNVAVRPAPRPIVERGHGPVVRNNDNRGAYVRGEVRGEQIQRGEVHAADQRAELRGERIERDRLEQLRLDHDRFYVGGRFTRPWISLAAPAPLYDGQLAVAIAPEYSTVSTIELAANGGATYVQSVGIQYADGHTQNVPVGIELTSSYDLPLDGSGVAPTNVTVYGQSAYGATVAVTAL